MRRNGTKTRFWIVLGLFASLSLPLPARADVNGCRDSFATETGLSDLYSELVDQVCQTFEQKFSKVTTDFASTSEANLRAISDALRLSLGPSRFESLWASSLPLVDSVKRKLVVQSETSLKSALSILDSEFYSKDELIRRKILPLDSKLHGATTYAIDGKIGQQDAVFLAIKPTDIQANHVGDADYIFGDVKFVFDENVLDRGYFTLYPFDNSPEEFRLRTKGGASNSNLKGAIDLYRKFLFSGKSALNELIHLSLVQSLSEASDRTRILTQEILGAYTRFPRPLELTQELKHYWSFWELKVPTRLSLDRLSAIQLRKSLTDEEIGQFVKKARQFAEKTGRTTRVTEGFDQVGYDLSIARGAQGNHGYYEFVRIEFGPASPEVTQTK
ncbi:MAG: hypothetical protein JST04_03040 [Bdellovibrionales bacterium]|nr:hypothetical protein [Bdellovibrionales bacterium]